jgi:hypothetical protein
VRRSGDRHGGPHHQYSIAATTVPMPGAVHRSTTIDDERR